LWGWAGVRPCRIGYAPFFVIGSCLWFLPPSAVEKSRSAKARAGRQMGRWADRCRGIGHQLPTASEGPQAGRRHRGPQRLDCPTPRLQNRGNKARMSMKTNSREVEKSRSRGVVKPDQEVRRGDAYGLSLFDFQLSTVNCLTRIRRNKARMSMKTKEEVKKSRTPSPGSLLSPPSPISGVRWSDPNRTRNRTPQGRGLLLTRFGRDADCLSLSDSQLSTSGLEFGGTKRECL
jgi:hypothetical protein